jgi:hypothetical protein
VSTSHFAEVDTPAPDGGAARVIAIVLPEGLTVFLHGVRPEWGPAFSLAGWVPTDERPDDGRWLPAWLDPNADASDELWAALREDLAPLWAGLPDVAVHVFPRAALDRAWWLRWYHDGNAEHAEEDPYPGALSVRAYAAPADRRVVVVADALETVDSFAWLLCHELTHVALPPFVRYGLSAVAERLGVPDDVRLDGAMHDQHPEEATCNAIASALTGGDFGPAWWRGQLREVPMSITTRL